MSTIDSALLACLVALETAPPTPTNPPSGALVRAISGTMRFPALLEGPPGRVHGGIHPLVRTLPILAHLQGAGVPGRVRIDAALQKALPLETDVPFDGSYATSGAGYLLTTRFLGSDRLVATAREPEPSELPTGEALARFRALYETALAEESTAMRVLGVPYRASASAIVADLRDLDAIDPESHLARCIDPGGSLGLAALATQLDAVGATSQGARMRHPHFTKHIALAFDTRALAPRTGVLVLGNRTNIVEDADSDAPKVDVRGVAYGTAVVEVIAVDAAFERCFAHGFVTSHPVDPNRYAGFEGMRKLREV